MKQLVKKKRITTEIAIVLLTTFLWNQIVYRGTRYLAQNWRHYDMTTSADRFVPFVPWTIVIYFGCYLFWGINYYLCAAQDKEKRNRFFTADFLAIGACFILFLAIPTTNIRPIISGTVCGILQCAFFTK